MFMLMVFPGMFPFVMFVFVMIGLGGDRSSDIRSVFTCGRRRVAADNKGALVGEHGRRVRGPAVRDDAQGVRVGMFRVASAHDDWPFSLAAAWPRR